MAFTYSEERRSERVIDWIENTDAGLRIGVSRLGGELISVQRRDAAGKWIGFLHRDNDLVAPATGWTGHATVMGFYLHRLKEGRSVYRGHEICGGTHSFARTKKWHLVEQRDGGLKYRITPDDFSPTEYPLNVSLELTYSINTIVPSSPSVIRSVSSVIPSEVEGSRDASLKVTPPDPSTSLRSARDDKKEERSDPDDGERVRIQFHFANSEPILSAHVGFGVHPGFAASAFENFQFNMPAGLYRRHLAPGNFLSGETHDIEFAGGAMPFKREELPRSFIIELVHVSSREFAFEDRASGRAATIDVGSAPYLTLWSDGGAFLCIEPCWGLTDAHEQRAFEDKLGIQVIPPGCDLAAECSIAPRLLS
ncbi:MAG: hypothetical protein ACR2FX_02540 [Chthoniobacterales bacterium]